MPDGSPERNFYEKLTRQNSLQRHLCVGLDANIRTIRSMMVEGLNLHERAHATDAELVVAYNTMVIKETSEIAAAYKPNRAFYDQLGRDGFWALDQTFHLLRVLAPGAVHILDAKYADIDSTNDGYVHSTFGILGADAVTVHNYMGYKAMRPFLDIKDKGILVLARTSNEGGDEFQDLEVTSKGTDWEGHEAEDISIMYQKVARDVRKFWNYNGNAGVVAGATYPNEAKIIREIVGDRMPILVPGVGAQGQTAEVIVLLVMRPGQLGVINSSRGIIFPKRREGQTLEQAIRRSALDTHRDIIRAQAA